MNRHERRKAARAEREHDAREAKEFGEQLDRVADKIATGGMVAIDCNPVVDLALSQDRMDVACVELVYKRLTTGKGDCVHCKRRLYPAGPAVASHIVRIHDPNSRRAAVASVLCRDCMAKPDALEPVRAMARDMFPGMVPLTAANFHDGPATVQ